MRIIIVRHGDPNYELDTLTKTGWREAELAAEYLSKLQVKAFYVSPLGRAQDTAGCTLKKMNRTAETLDWLREFEAHIDRPDVKKKSRSAGTGFHRIWKRIWIFMTESAGIRQTLCKMEMWKKPTNGCVMVWMPC